MGSLGAVILAHQGGWDEMLLVAAPIALLAAVLWMANRRATRLRDERDAGSAGTTGSTGAHDAGADARSGDDNLS
jgi:hypothetical protein